MPSLPTPKTLWNHWYEVEEKRINIFSPTPDSIKNCPVNGLFSLNCGVIKWGLKRLTQLFRRRVFFLFLNNLQLFFQILLGQNREKKFE